MHCRQRRASKQRSSFISGVAGVRAYSLCRQELPARISVHANVSKRGAYFSLQQPLCLGGLTNAPSASGVLDVPDRRLRRKLCWRSEVRDRAPRALFSPEASTLASSAGLPENFLPCCIRRTQLDAPGRACELRQGKPVALLSSVSEAAQLISAELVCPSVLLTRQMGDLQAYVVAC